MPSRLPILIALQQEVSRLPNNPDKLRFGGLCQQVHGVRVSFWAYSMSVPALISFLTIMLVAQATSAKGGPSNLQTTVHENAAFDEQKLAELRRGEPVVTRLQPNHKQEVAVYGMVQVEALPAIFLHSFRETIATKSNPA